MTDAGFTYITAGLWVVALVGYALRVRKFGSYNNDRVSGVGGTVLVGQNIMQATYWAIDPIVRGLVRLGATPDGVTWTALGLGLGAGVAVAFGWFGLACLLATVSTICDILDGQVARVLGVGSARGELLDAAVDRYTEFAFIAGFIVFAHDSQLQLVIALAAMLASYMISYASAKAEAMSVKTPRGLMRRHERAIFVILSAGMTPVLAPLIVTRWPTMPYALPFLVGLVLVGVIGNYAALDRFVQVWRGLAAPAPKPE